METLLREANENIRELQAEVETKSTALSHEKSENAASQSTIDRLKSEFEEKLNEREESLKKMFMRNGFNRLGRYSFSCVSFYMKSLFTHLS